MWLHTLSIMTSVFATAQGMCFGTPFLQQQITCPSTMVYYPQLCICGEPQPKFHFYKKIGFVRDAPNMLTRTTIQPLDLTQTYTEGLLSLRHRLTASLPDTGFGSHGGTIPGITSLLLYPDRLQQNYHQVSLQESVEPNIAHIPRSWKKGDFHKFWQYGKRRYSIQNDEPKWLPQTRGFRGTNKLTPLFEELKQKQRAWQDAVLKKAHTMVRNQALAENFFTNKNIARNGISPDTPTVFKQDNNGVAPDSQRYEFFRSSKEALKRSMLALKEATLKKHGLENILPRRPFRRQNSFIRSVMQL